MKGKKHGQVKKAKHFRLGENLLLLRIHLAREEFLREAPWFDVLPFPDDCSEDDEDTDLGLLWVEISADPTCGAGAA